LKILYGFGFAVRFLIDIRTIIPRLQSKKSWIPSKIASLPTYSDAGNRTPSCPEIINAPQLIFMIHSSAPYTTSKLTSSNVASIRGILMVSSVVVLVKLHLMPYDALSSSFFPKKKTKQLPNSNAGNRTRPSRDMLKSSGFSQVRAVHHTPHPSYPPLSLHAVSWPIVLPKKKKGLTLLYLLFGCGESNPDLP
jgi:hypothetical protein